MTERRTDQALAAPRCGARTRKGTPCQSPAVTGRKRCRMHGGAERSGAPKGNRNALKSGLYTKDAIEARRAVRALLKSGRQLLERIEKS